MKLLTIEGKSGDPKNSKNGTYYISSSISNYTYNGYSSDSIIKLSLEIVSFNVSLMGE